MRFQKHGMRNTPTYKSWQSMKDRCSNPKAISYPFYGGIGIGYDPDWDTFENFFRDMGERPKGLSLDREDSRGQYCKGNCKWSSAKEQANNRRSNIKILFDGEIYTPDELMEILGISRPTLDSRLRRAFRKEEGVYHQYREFQPRKRGKIGL